MTTTMRYGGHYNNSIVKMQKTHKIHTFAQQTETPVQTVQEKYEIERSLEQKEKEKEAREFCNIFTGKTNENMCINLFDDRCMNLFEDIEHLEQKLKHVKKKL